jgi:probable addiction module antidote protein
MKKAKTYTEGLDKRLQDSAFAAEFLSAAAEEGKEELLMALRDLARARGIARVAKGASRGRASLYKTLSKNGNPELSTFLSILNALNLKVHFEAA